MSGKGSNRRPESTAGAYGCGYDAIRWGASTERMQNGRASGQERNQPAAGEGSAVGPAVHVSLSSPGSRRSLSDLALLVVAFNLEYQAHIGASVDLFDACKFEACQSALEDGCKALEAAKAAVLTIGLELSR